MVMPVVNAVFLDTNILIYANLAKSPWHQNAVNALDYLQEAGQEIWISRQVLREYLAAMSRGDSSGPVKMESLLQDVAEFSLSFKIADGNVKTTDVLVKLLQRVSVGAKQIHDANIVATMLATGVHRLLTNNVSDFVRFTPEIEILDLQNFQKT